MSVAVASLLITHNRLRSGSAEFKLCVHFLQARSQRFNLFLLRVNLATCFEKLIEQHRVHRVVADGINLPTVVASHQIGLTFSTCSATRPNCGMPSGSISFL